MIEMRACAACESISSNPSPQSDCVRTFISRGCCSKAGENGTHACISCIYSKACTCIKLRTRKMNTAHCMCVRGVYILEAVAEPRDVLRELPGKTIS
jgi:hypothetical protein